MVPVVRVTPWVTAVELESATLVPVDWLVDELVPSVVPWVEDCELEEFVPAVSVVDVPVE